MVTTIQHSNLSKEASDKLMAKNPDRIPVIITHLHNNLTIDKTKYLVPTDLKFGQLQYVFRKYLKIKPEHAIFIFITGKGMLLPSSTLVTEIFEQYNNNGYLELTISLENTFG